MNCYDLFSIIPQVGKGPPLQGVGAQLEVVEGIQEAQREVMECFQEAQEVVTVGAQEVVMVGVVAVEVVTD